MLPEMRPDHHCHSHFLQSCVSIDTRDEEVLLSVWSETIHFGSARLQNHAHDMCPIFQSNPTRAQLALQDSNTVLGATTSYRDQHVPFRHTSPSQRKFWFKSIHAYKSSKHVSQRHEAPTGLALNTTGPTKRYRKSLGTFPRNKSA